MFFAAITRFLLLLSHASPLLLQHALHEAGAVPEDHEVELPLRGPIVDPAAELDGGADVLAEVFDRDDGHGRCGHGLVVSRCAGRRIAWRREGRTEAMPWT